MQDHIDIVHIWLAVTGTWLLFFHILGMSSSQLTFIFFKGVGIPPTRYCMYVCVVVCVLQSIFESIYCLFIVGLFDAFFAIFIEHYIMNSIWWKSKINCKYVIWWSCERLVQTSWSLHFHLQVAAFRPKAGSKLGRAMTPWVVLECCFLQGCFTIQKYHKAVYKP